MNLSHLKVETSDQTRKRNTDVPK